MSPTTAKTPGTLPTAWLTKLTRLSVRHPRRVLLASLLLALTALLGAASHLELRTSNLDLIDHHHPEVAHVLDVAETFGTPNVLVVVLDQRRLKLQ